MPTTEDRSPLRWPVIVFAAVVVLFHALAMVLPSGVNWGFHHLAFLPDVAAVCFLVLMVVVLIPHVREWVFAMMEGLAKIRRGIIWGLALTVLCVLFWLLREATFFLGDGYLVIRNLASAHSVSDLPAPFPTAPLSAFLAYHIRLVLEYFQVEPAAQLAWQIQSVVCGLLAVPMTLGLAGELAADGSSRRTMAFFLLAGGALQLFCGYVETYPPAYTATLLFMWMSLRYLSGKATLFAPMMSFGLLFTFHFGMLSLLPALCVLVVVSFRRGGLGPALLAPASGVLLIVLILWMCGYAPHNYLGVLLQGGSYFLPVSVHDNWQAAYPLFSVWHFSDLVNEYMLLSPFVLILVPVALGAIVQRGTWKLPATIFIGCAFAGAAVWTFMTNFEVGMSRDWDVMAPLSVCVLVFAVYGCGLAREEGQRSLVSAMALVTLLHSLAWIAVNSGEGRSIARDVMLQDARVRSRRAVAYACEDLADFYRNRKQYIEAVPFLEETVAIDSTNARRWLSLANVYQHAHENEDAVHAYEESIHYGIRDKAAFFNLGVLYYNHGRLDDAILALSRAAAIDSTDTLISVNLRMMRTKRAGQEDRRR